MTDNCVFCDIVNHKAPAEILIHSLNALVIVPLKPVVMGHVLVIPRVHVSDFTADPIVSSELMLFTAEIARNSGYESVNLITSKGAAATQTVFHLHFHLVPRNPGDNITLPWTEQQRKSNG